jgi:inhibitor of cysteine peptidase
MHNVSVSHRAIVILLALWALATACASAQEVKLGAQDSDSQVEVEEGQTLIITLESNPTTGFRWEVARVDASVLQQQGEAEYNASDSKEPPLVGAGGTETLRFKAMKAGQTTLELIYHRSWEKDVEPLETFSIQVVVR